MRHSSYPSACTAIYVAITLFAMMPIASASAQTGPVTVAVFLNMLGDKLNGAIDNAKNAGLGLEIQAGREAYLAIENAKNAYAEIMNMTLDRIDDVTRQRLDELNALVNDVANRTYENLDKLVSRVQTVINSLPFRTHEPQVNRVSPRSITPAIATYEVPVSFEGNFEFAADPKLQPVIKFGSRAFPPSAVTTQYLTFLVPTSVLLASGSNPDNTKPGYVVGELTVPWCSGGFLGMFRRRTENKYKLIIGALPVSPGRIKIVRKIEVDDHKRRRFESGEFYQTSADDGGNDDKKNVPYAVSPTNGWTIVRGTHAFNNRWSKGNWSQTFKSDDGNRVVYEVTTIHKVIGTSGQVKFTISFDEERTAKKETETSEDVALKWGDSKTYPYKVGEWKVIFDGFDGTHSEFIGSSSDHPFLRVTAQGGGLTISTVDPKKVAWP